MAWMRAQNGVGGGARFYLGNFCFNLGKWLCGGREVKRLCVRSILR